MATVLTVEDEVLLAASLAQAFAESGYNVRVANDGDTAWWELTADNIDVLVLDLMVPGVSGLEPCRRLRARGNNIPVLMLTARDTTEDVVRGLDAGADDYLTKPFALDELQARVRSLLRRGYQQRSSETLSVDTLMLDLASRPVEVDGRSIAPTAREFDLLEFLVRRPETVLTRGRLMEVGWPDEDPASNVFEVHVSHLRRRLDPARPRRFIKTVRGVGYLLKGDNA